MTHRWSLRETDLWNYSLSLQEIDKMRIDGKFIDAEGNIPVGQYVSHSPGINFQLFLSATTGAVVSSKAVLRSHLQIVVLQ